MKAIFFSTRSYEKVLLEKLKPEGAEFYYLDTQLTEETAGLAKGYDVVSIFVNDKAHAAVLETFASLGIRGLALRSAGFNHVDMKAAEKLGLKVERVPAYSPHAVAEHALALLLTLNRKTHRAFNRVREGNFSLEGLVGWDLHGKSVGVVGTGKIGEAFCSAMKGLGCKVLAYDIQPNKACEQMGVEYVNLDRLFKESDVLSLHCPLTPETRHLVSAERLQSMKPGAFLINTGRGALIDTQALIQCLKHRKLAGVGLDVYEEEEAVFFADHSIEGIDDDVLIRLMSFPNVLITGHQAFLTQEALHAIAQTSVDNICSIANDA